ncbi:MAG TPA: hypothetical protein VGM27_13675 [Acidobacteriaceae bacterium]
MTMISASLLLAGMIRDSLPLYYICQNALAEFPPNILGQPALPPGDGYEPDGDAFVGAHGRE